MKLNTIATACAFLASILSCTSPKPTSISDPMAVETVPTPEVEMNLDQSDLSGTYSVKALDVPGYGDVKALLVLTKTDEGYSANIKNDLNMVKILSTEVHGSNVFISAKAGSQSIDFDLVIEQGVVKGWLSNTYEVIGERIK